MCTIFYFFCGWKNINKLNIDLTLWQLRLGDSVSTVPATPAELQLRAELASVQAKLDAMQKAAQPQTEAECKGMKRAHPVDWDQPLFQEDPDNQLGLSQSQMTEIRETPLEDKSGAPEILEKGSAAAAPGETMVAAPKASPAEGEVQPASGVVPSVPVEPASVVPAVPAKPASDATPMAGAEAAVESLEVAEAAVESLEVAGGMAPEDGMVPAVPEKPADVTPMAEAAESLETKVDTPAPTAADCEVPAEPASVGECETSSAMPVEGSGGGTKSVAPNPVPAAVPAETTPVVVPEQIVSPAPSPATVVVPEQIASPPAPLAEQIESLPAPSLQKLTAESMPVVAPNPIVSPPAPSPQDMEIERLRHQLSLLESRLVVAAAPSSSAQHEATPGDEFDLDGVPIDLDSDILAAVNNSTAPGINQSADQPEEAELQVVNFVTHKNEGARMGRFMDSQEGQKFPHMLELWRGTPADTW